MVEKTPLDLTLVIDDGTPRALDFVTAVERMADGHPMLLVDAPV